MQADPYDKPEHATKMGWGATFDFPKIFSNRLFSCSNGCITSILDFKATEKVFKVQHHAGNNIY